MKKNIYASTHGSIRMKERIGNIMNNKTYLRYVVRNGKTKKDFKGEFFYYILQKESKRDKKIKIYKNFVYIFNKSSHGLITTYPVPEEFLPTKQYEYTKEEIEILKKISSYGKKTVDIKTNNLNLSGIVYFLENKPRENLEVLLKDNSIYKLKLQDICDIELSSNNYEIQESKK